jgi:general secretion pathway protein K
MIALFEKKEIAPFVKLLNDQKGGVALILVLWVMVILVAIVGEFSYSMRTEVNITRNFKEEEEAYQLAIAGVERAKIEILLSKDASYEYLNEDGKLIFENGYETLERKGSLAKASFSYIIRDEDRKLNINSASIEQIKSILRNSGLELDEVDVVGDSIIDWRDTNDLHMLNGAEEDYYQSLDVPYSAKDGPFNSIEELLLVRGVTPEIFYGSKVKEEEEDKEDKKEYKGLEQFFSTLDVNAKSININTALREVLEAVFDDQTADNIMIQRESGPLTAARSGGSIKSSFFTILSTGTTLDGSIKRTIKTTLRRQGSQLKIIHYHDNFFGHIK